MDLMSHVKADPEILREPRGFMRIVQLVLAIFAFGTITVVRTNSHIIVSCPTGENSSALFDLAINYSYPFKISKTGKVLIPFCKASAEFVAGRFDVSYASAAQFFCFIGVMTFLILLVLIPAYVFLGSLFSKNSLPAKVDFIVSCVFTLLWFIASTAWADNLTKMSQYMDPENLIAVLDECTPKLCSPGRPGDMSSLIVSVLFGFLNMGLSGASLWFLFKETDWHKDGDGSDNPDVYADPGYQTQEYTSDPTIPTTPTGSMSGSFGAPSGQAGYGGGGLGSFGGGGVQDNNYSNGQSDYYSGQPTY